MENLNERIVNYLERVWSENKAKGLLAQVRLYKYLTNDLKRKKYYQGCWLLTPKRSDFFKYRFSFFIHSKLEIGNSLPEILELDNIMEDIEEIKFQRIASFLNKAGLGVIYCVPVGKTVENINWNLFRYDLEREKLLLLDAERFFENWEGRGRPFSSRGWSENTRRYYLELDDNILLSLYLHEHFYTEYIKRKNRKSVWDPYDVDGFFITYSSNIVFPIEVKEKSPANDGIFSFFGIDAGRVLMLLRLCLPNEANALYIVREVDSSEDRKFIEWKFITLSDIIMLSSWNLQMGGRGMGGQQTQVIKLPYSIFKTFDKNVLKDRYLDSISKLSDEVRKKTDLFIQDRKKLFGW